MRKEPPAAKERRERIGKVLMAVGALCLAASIALLIAAQALLHRAGR